MKRKEWLLKREKRRWDKEAPCEKEGFIRMKEENEESCAEREVEQIGN